MTPEDFARLTAAQRAAGRVSRMNGLTSRLEAALSDRLARSEALARGNFGEALCRWGHAWVEDEDPFSGDVRQTCRRCRHERVVVEADYEEIGPSKGS